MNASEISRLLAQSIAALASELLPNGHQEGQEWRCGSVAGEAGSSLGVHLAGRKAGVWRDFASGEGGDALDLVAAVLCYDLREALTWARRWLGIEEREAARPKTPEIAPKQIEDDPEPERWRRPWSKAQPIGRTLAWTYLKRRGLGFFEDMPEASVLRFLPRHGRRSPDGRLEYHPALLGLLRDLGTGAPCGIHNIYLEADGSDRVRDKKGKTSWGRAAGAAVMLSHFEEPAHGLVIAEGIETGIALRLGYLGPVWALVGAGNLTAIPVLAGIEALTIAADNDEPGQAAAAACAARWRAAGREVLIITPAVGDWADGWRVMP